MDNDQLKEHVQRAVNKAYFYLKFRPRTKKEVTLYLQKKGQRFHWTPEVIDKAVNDLEEENLINDKSFIEWFVDQRSSAKPKSTFALRTELMRLGVEKDLLDAYFESHELPEDELAYKALQSRWNRFKSLDRQERYIKASQFLARRGFNFTVIKESLKKMEDR